MIKIKKERGVRDHEKDRNKNSRCFIRNTYAFRRRKRRSRTGSGDGGSDGIYDIFKRVCSAGMVFFKEN